MQTPAPFGYERAKSVDEALRLLEQHGPEARLVAGGHSLLPMMKLRLARPDTLIDINDLEDLDYIRVVGDVIAIGAMTRHATIKSSPILGEHYRMFADAEKGIADPIVRNRGTIGGSLCQADPAEDLSAVCSALRADLVVRGSGGTRTVPAREFQVGPYQTVVGDAEMLIEARIPIRTGVGSAYEKVERRAGDWAVASVGAWVRLEADTVADVGIGLAAVGAPHDTCPEAEEHLRGGPAGPAQIRAAAAICHDACRPSADQRGPEDFKRHLVRVLSERALTRSVARAKGAEA